MFNLNPLGNPDAFWQHAVMILVSAVVGYIIGHTDTKKTVQKLQSKLTRIESDLEAWYIKNNASGNEIISAANTGHDQPSASTVTDVNADEMQNELRKSRG